MGYDQPGSGARFGHGVRLRGEHFYLGALIAATGGLLLFTPILPLLLAYTLIGLVVTAVHEGGHALAGKWMEYRIPAVRIGPFKIMRECGRLRMSLAPGLWDGRCYAEPLHDWNRRRREAVLTAGGPAANFAFMLLMGTVQWLVGPPSLHGPSASVQDVCSDMARALGVFSGATGVLNLIPFRIRGESSDGAVLLGLLWETIRDAYRRRW